ncbi:MAG: hypothetical protein HRU17_19595 [Polyangiaceae bacterium]|nr:hypothetical protein [Polyangiaceae bacterium]
MQFTDFQCPFGKRVEPTIAALLKRYGNALGLVVKNQPLLVHKRAIPAAQPEANFIKRIDHELAHARSLVKPSTPRGKSYEKSMKSAAVPAPLDWRDVGSIPKMAPSRVPANAPVVI